MYSKGEGGITAPDTAKRGLLKTVGEPASGLYDYGQYVGASWALVPYSSIKGVDEVMTVVHSYM